MFNLFITFGEDIWEKGDGYVLDKSRYLEYTSDGLKKRFGTLDDATIREISSFPCLFSYETGGGENAYIGWITRIRVRGHEIRVDYDIEKSLPPVPIHALDKLEWDLELGNYEKSRTHWAIKEVDLLPILIEEGLVQDADIKRQRPDSRVIKLGIERRVSDLHVQPSVFRVPSEPPDAKLVSVMMPFGSDFGNVYQAIKDACDKAGLDCQRADDIWQESELIQDIFSLIFRSKIVICDFSTRNPNVFYEAGIAHTLGKSVIPIAQNETDVPFDLRHHRFIKYLDNGEGRLQLLEKLVLRLHTLVRS